MEIRFAKSSDTEELKKMWLDIFNDPKQFVEWNFKHNYRPENVILCESGGEIASALHLIPYDISLKGEIKRAVYISAVATKDKFRKKGCASKIICAALNHIEKNGFDLAFLVPAINGFYEKFGFSCVLLKKELCYEAKNICTEIPDFKKTDIKTAYEIYLKCMKDKALYLKRSLSDFSLIADDLLNNTGGELKILPDNSGYVMFKTGKDYTEVFEIMAKDKPSENLISDYIFSLKKPVKQTLPPVMIKSFKENNGIYSKNISRSNAYFNLIL